MSSDNRREQIAQAIQISTSKPVKKSATRALRDQQDRRHSREDALTDREFEYLVRASYRVKQSQRLEARAALFLAGRLGLRGGEIAHLQGDWVDWKDRVIEIPEHSTCTKGKWEGEVCGYCRRRAVEELRTNNLTVDEAINAIKHELGDEVLSDLGQEGIRQAALNLRNEVNITYEEAIGRRWKPKTKKSARRVPYDFDIRAEMVIEEFFEEFDSWSKSKSTVNRRIERLAETAEIDIDVYPHALRATAASTHASRGVSAFSLMSTMGWSDIGTARAYINGNDAQAAREIRSKHR